MEALIWRKTLTTDKKNIECNCYYILHLQMKSMFTQTGNAYKLTLQNPYSSFFLEIQKLR